MPVQYIGKDMATQREQSFVFLQEKICHKYIISAYILNTNTKSRNKKKVVENMHRKVK